MSSDVNRTKYEPQEIRTWGECTFDNENFRELADYIESLQAELARLEDVYVNSDVGQLQAEVERLRADLAKANDSLLEHLGWDYR